MLPHSKLENAREGEIESGVNLDLIDSVQIGAVELSFEVSESGEEISIIIPAGHGSSQVLTLFYGSETLEQPIGFSEALDDIVVNAGTFTDIVALYAKNLEGRRLSAKVGRDWVIVDSLASRFETNH